MGGGPGRWLVRRGLPIAATAVLCGLYARGGPGCWLGFVALVPWLRALDEDRTLAGALLGAWALSLAYTLAVFSWFGAAIGAFTHLGTPAGLAVLLACAPLFQPQILAFALVRQLAGRRHGAAVQALAAAASWVAAEALLPRMLGDTLGDGLYPSRWMRQAADLGGTAGLTVMLLLANEGIAAAVARRRGNWREIGVPLGLAALVPLLLAGYGWIALTAPTRPASATPLRVGLVQSAIVDYEEQRRERGSAAVVREVLDTHFAMSYDAIEHQHADAVLWSETVYPTTFGHPKSAAGAALDREILDTMAAAGVPFVFGTYDRDAGGEYNAAAFVAPRTGLLGFYRKTRLFPLSEYVPAWMDGPILRHALPWTGSWHPGTGARVFPLRLADGREIPVLPLICLDDVDTGLAAEGARLGAQAILTLSNDSWFSRDPRGAALHQAVAAFRSIETRLPQFRVTTNGFSAVIDRTGTVDAGTRMGERTLVIGNAPIAEPAHTLVTAWGDWVGRAAAGFLLLLVAATALRRACAPSANAGTQPEPPALPADVAVLPPYARASAGLLRAGSRAGLLGMAAVVLFGDGLLQSDTLTQIRAFATVFLAPEAAAWCLLRAFAAHARLEGGSLVLTRGRRRLELALADVTAARIWSLPIPCPGISLRVQSGGLPASAASDAQEAGHSTFVATVGIVHPDPAALAELLVAAGGHEAAAKANSRAVLGARARRAVHRGVLDSPWAKYLLFPLLLALPAFRLHQHIAYGGAFGEYYTFGLKAYFTAFGLWWAAWIIGVVLCASVLRAVIEAGALGALLLAPRRAVAARRCLERLGLGALYLGLPSWLLARVLLA